MDDGTTGRAMTASADVAELAGTESEPARERLSGAAPVLWIVVPCYDEEEVLPTTARLLAAKLRSLLDRGFVADGSCVLLVNDGSRDATWGIVRALHDDPTSLGIPEAAGLFRGISFSHNEGHQNALYAGLMHALAHGCDCAVSLDADLQDDPDAIDEMLDAYARGSEVVFGVRSSRSTDTAFKRGTAEAFYGLMRWLGVELVSDSADYRLMGRRSLEALSHYGEANLFLRGIVPSLGFPSSKVYYERAPRAAGESKYPLGKMVSFALEGITSFSVRPLRIVTVVGLAFLLVALAMVVYALASAATGHTVAGWTSLMVSVWFVGGVTVTSLGVVGEYVGRIYVESKHRPRYVIAEELE